MRHLTGNHYITEIANTHTHTHSRDVITFVVFVITLITWKGMEVFSYVREDLAAIGHEHEVGICIHAHTLTHYH